MFGLEIIAYFTMLVDHVTATLIGAYISSDAYDGTIMGINGSYVESAGRAIGRIAFIIFAFMITQAMQYTKDNFKYVVRLLAFSIISEVPFDFGLFNSYMDIEYQNVGFTLLFGACAIALIQYFEGRRALQLLSVLIFMALAGILKTDYGYGGVALIVIMYICRYNFYAMAVLGFAVFICLLTLDNTIYLVLKYRDSYNEIGSIISLTGRVFKWYMTSETYGIIGFAPIYVYMKEFRLGRRFPKIVKYSFYPLHLTVIGVINLFVFGW